MLKSQVYIEELEERARMFAIGAHGGIGQVRQHGPIGEPYYFHVERVALMVKAYGGTPEMVAAAYLHDVVEDTKIDLDLINKYFGGVVALLVAEVTDVSRTEDGNRAARKAIDRKHLSHASPQGQTIKLADLIDNSESILREDPEGFAKVYIPEKELLLQVMTKGHPELYQRAAQLVKDWYAREPK